MKLLCIKKNIKDTTQSFCMAGVKFFCFLKTYFPLIGPWSYCIQITDCILLSGIPNIIKLIISFEDESLGLLQTGVVSHYLSFQWVTAMWMRFDLLNWGFLLALSNTFIIQLFISPFCTLFISSYLVKSNSVMGERALCFLHSHSLCPSPWAQPLRCMLAAHSSHSNGPVGHTCSRLSLWRPSATVQRHFVLMQAASKFLELGYVSSWWWWWCRFCTKYFELTDDQLF